MKNKFLAIALAFAFSSSFFIACKKDKGDDPNTLPEPSKESFIPQINHKYEYSISDEGGYVGTATKWIDGGQNSEGKQLYNLHTHLEFKDGDMALDDKMYVANGKTYVTVNMPDAWNLVIEGFKKIPGTTVQEAKTTGFPGYMVMENAIKEGSKLTWEINGTLGQYIKLLQNQSGNTTTIEMSQQLFPEPGSVIAVESVTVPAGTFTCSKFTYVTSNTQLIKINGQGNSPSTGTEIITVWMAHGIGVVKSESEIEFNGTHSRSATTLTKIH